jgi:hypothetical protein
MILAPGKLGSGREVIVVMKHKRSLISVAMVTIMLVSLSVVCVSTSVSAAESSSANVQSPPVVGAPVGIAGAPAACWQDWDNYHLFVRGGDGALWWQHWNRTDGLKAWTSLGGRLTSDPAAVWYQGSIYVFVRGGDGALWWTYSFFLNDHWSWVGWTRLGGYLAPDTGPAAYQWYDPTRTGARIGWFVTGGDHALWHGWYDEAGYHNFERLGGYLTSSPAAAVNYQKHDIVPDDLELHAFARGGNGALWSRNTVKGLDTWDSWHNLGGYLAPGIGPAASSWDNGVDVFVVGGNHALWNKQFSTYANWKEWLSIGGYLTSSAAAPLSPTDGGRSNVDLYARGRDNALWNQKYHSTYLERYGDGWHGPYAGP